jgi:hypothetical protein
MSAVEDGWLAMSSAGHDRGSGSRVGTLCLACVRGTGVDGGGVSVFSTNGTPVFMHATDSTSRVIEDLQFRLGEGPCIEAASTGVPVMVPDLASHEDELAERWPAFLAEIADTDARALFAFPIRVAGIGLGILDLYRRTPGALAPDQVTAGRSGAEAMGNSLITPDDEGDNESYPLTVHRAAGMVMIQLDSSIEEALVRLRATAYLEGMLVTALALDVLEGRRRFAKEES